MTIPPLRERPAFDALAKHHSELVGRHLRELFHRRSTAELVLEPCRRARKLPLVLDHVDR